MEHILINLHVWMFIHAKPGQDPLPHLVPVVGRGREKARPRGRSVAEYTPLYELGGGGV